MQTRPQQVTSPPKAEPPERRPASRRNDARASLRGLRAPALAAALALLTYAAPACARSLLADQNRNAVSDQNKNAGQNKNVAAGQTKNASAAAPDPAAQGAAAAREKRERTPAQRKIDSQLLQAIYRKRGEAEAKGVPGGEPAVRYDDEGRALVSVRARPVARVMAKIVRLGGVVISHSERYDDIRAALPLEKLEALAALKEVRAIMPAEEATTNGASTQ
jgi:hypothetical protein